MEIDGKDEWNFGNGYVKNIVNVGVDNISSSHAENLQEYFSSASWRRYFWY